MVVSEKYKGYRTPKSIIGYAVRKYYRYKLSLRDVSEMLLERVLEITYETIRKWCKLGARRLQKAYGRKEAPLF